MEIPISSFGALESKSLGESTKASTPEVQKSTNLKYDLWFFHSGLPFSRLTTNNQKLQQHDDDNDDDLNRVFRI
jgi:hypothetical protein